jgi:hypothetical protein
MTDTAGVYASDPMMQQVQLGVNVEHFITQDPVGRYLVERAKQSREAALERLASVDPTNARSISALQYEAKIPELFLHWLDEALANAEAAEEQIRAEDLAAQHYGDGNFPFDYLTVS